MVIFVFPGTGNLQGKQIPSKQTKKTLKWFKSWVIEGFGEAPFLRGQIFPQSPAIKDSITPNLWPEKTRTTFSKSTQRTDFFSNKIQVHVAQNVVKNGTVWELRDLLDLVVSKKTKRVLLMFERSYPTKMVQEKFSSGSRMDIFAGPKTLKKCLKKTLRIPPMIH